MSYCTSLFEYVWELFVLEEPVYIHATADRWQLGSPSSSFFFFYLRSVCFLMYLSVQLVQIASSITRSRYENVDPPAPRAQTYCYECNQRASSGRSSSRLLCSKEKSGDIRGWTGWENHLIIGTQGDWPSFLLWTWSVGQVTHIYYSLYVWILKVKNWSVIISGLFQGHVAMQQPSRLLLLWN